MFSISLPFRISHSKRYYVIIGLIAHLGMQKNENMRLRLAKNFSQGVAHSDTFDCQFLVTEGTTLLT